MQNATDTRPYFLVISGKMGSGKDTLVPLLCDQLGITRFEQVAYAAALKGDVDRYLATLREPNSRISELFKTENIDPKHWMTLTTLLVPLSANPEITAYSRTPQMRELLQYLGTDVRRATDDDYWVRRGLAAVTRHLDEGTSVFITDARFPNEIVASRAAGAIAIRLIVSPEEQERRLRLRDGEAANPGLTHMSETALDDYSRFDIICDTDSRTPEECAEHIVTLMNGSPDRR